MTLYCYHCHHFLFNQFNFSHTINHLSFGDEYPGQQNPLDLYSQIATEDPPTGTEDE